MWAEVSPDGRWIWTSSGTSLGPDPVLVDGPRREIERTKSSSTYETEGLATANALSGELHWQIQPQIPFYGQIIPSGQRADEAAVHAAPLGGGALLVR